MHQLVSSLCTVTLVATLAGCLGDDPNTVDGLNGLRPNKPGAPEPQTAGPVRTVSRIDPGAPLKLFNPDGVTVAVGTWTQDIDAPGLCTGCSASVVHDVIEAEPGMFVDTMTLYGTNVELCSIIAKRYDMKSTIEFNSCGWLTIKSE